MMNLLMIMKKIMIFSKKVLNTLHKKHSNNNNPENNVFEDAVMKKITERRIERPNIDNHEDLEMEKINFE